MKIYLDIDGVLLTKDLQNANYLIMFLTFITKHFDVNWLTTHCKGDATSAINYLSQFLTPENLNLIKSIKPTNWNTLKTEAIDFKSDFFIIDDYLFEAEKKEIQKHNRYDSWIQVNLRENPNQLKDIISILKSQ